MTVRPTTPSPIEMDPDLAELISSSPPPTSAPVNNQVSDLLSAFTEDDVVDNEKIEPYIPSKIQRGNFWDAETKQFYKWDELMELKKEREQSDTIH